MSDPHPLLQAYLNGELDDQGYIDFNAWLREDPEHLREFAVASFLAQELGEALSEQSAAAQPSVTDMASAAQQGQMDADVLDMLQQLEAQADIETVTLVGELPPAKAKGPSELSAHDFKAAGIYLLRHTFTPKRVAIMATAAAVLLGAVLAIVLMDGPEPTPDVAQTPDRPAIESKPIVATLTATHNAVWSSDSAEGASAPGSLTPGSKLHPNTRLTLTAGFAEITTNDGAIAILEAPATIELIDNDNALRLHAGKLVGICETESSKGFLVRTPHMDITDLGTRFGIDAISSVATEVHVLEGEVEVAMKSDKPLEKIQTQLLAGQAVRAEAGSNDLIALDEDRRRFASALAFIRVPLPPGAAEVGITALRGDVMWSPASTYLDSAPKKWVTDDRAVVIEELVSFPLEEEALVTLLGPGTTADITESMPDRSIQGGTRLRTYTVVFNPETRGQIVEAHGEITFEGEVLGIATQESQAVSFSNMIDGKAKLTQLKVGENRWADVMPSAVNRDFIGLKQDRRTVAFSYAGTAGGTDAVRVFVRVPNE